MKLSIPMIALGGVLLAVAFVASRGARETGALLVSGTVDMVDGVIGEAGSVLGAVVGVPRTQLDQCAADRAAGRTWDASFSCPAKDFLSYLFS